MSDEDRNATRSDEVARMAGAVFSLDERRRTERAKQARRRANEAKGTRHATSDEHAARVAELAAADLDAQFAELDRLVEEGLPDDIVRKATATMRAARALQRMARNEPAGRADLDAVIDAFPELAIALVARAGDRAARGEIAAAIEDLDRAAELEPNDVVKWVTRTSEQVV